MSYFSLPYINNILHTHNFDFKIEIKKQMIHPTINKSLFNYINLIKQQIDDNIEQWDIVKRYTNPYEYIHTAVPQTNQAVSKYIPISRSYFKMIEIFKTFFILEYLDKDPICTFHLAEGPGGFIEAIVNKRNNSSDKYYGMTLQSQSEQVPGWKKSRKFLQKYKNVIIENGEDGTGNLYKRENLEYCYRKYRNSMNLITGDGGFDYSIDFNKQEILSSRLIFSQVIYAIIMQKKNGVFILKIFDVFDKFTVDIIYFLNILYDQVLITKPLTSRLANSEKYLVCKGFRLDNSDCYYSMFLSFFDEMSKYDNDINISPYDLSISNLLKIKIPYYFTIKLEEINAVIGQHQVENINSTINLIHNNIKKDKLENLKRNNIQKSVQWCIKHKIPYNKTAPQSNIFLTRR